MLNKKNKGKRTPSKGFFFVLKFYKFFVNSIAIKKRLLYKGVNKGFYISCIRQ